MKKSFFLDQNSDVVLGRCYSNEAPWEVDDGFCASKSFHDHEGP